MALYPPSPYRNYFPCLLLPDGAQCGEKSNLMLVSNPKPPIWTCGVSALFLEGICFHTVANKMQSAITLGTVLPSPTHYNIPVFHCLAGNTAVHEANVELCHSECTCSTALADL